ncbi:hypothetical protein GMRT_11638 [Giardia muris]|uniref:Uncharacterized protein n=1 Tax=Giardia muris TaxID=5742 RepID=A0A4Z1T1J5_GIAMU|nr:hypothetical protein GMRT_11638 [Giardia muris]|eukprot:TNJ29568.1 hypothetical protein GMRT_11638 [Giardia muris]
MSAAGLKPNMWHADYEAMERHVKELTEPKHVKDQLVLLCREIQELVRESECMDKVLCRQIHALNKAEQAEGAGTGKKLEALRKELADLTAEEKTVTDRLKSVKLTTQKRESEAKRVRSEASETVQANNEQFPVSLGEVETFLCQRPDATISELEEMTAALRREHEEIQASIAQNVDSRARNETELHEEEQGFKKQLAKLNRERARLMLDIDKQNRWISILTIKLRTLKRAAEAGPGIASPPSGP